MFDSLLVLNVGQRDAHFYRYDVKTGRIELLQELTDEVPPHVHSASWKGLADDRVNRHIDEHVLGHYEQVQAQLKKTMKSHGEKIVVGAPVETEHLFIESLEPELKDKLAFSYSPDPHAGVKELEKLLAPLAAKALTQEISGILAIIDNERHPAGRATIGREAVAEMLNLKQAQLVIYDPAQPYVGAICPNDGAVAFRQTTCPLCAMPMHESSDVLGALGKLASACDAHMIEVTDGTLLEPEAHGIVGLRRF